MLTYKQLQEKGICWTGYKRKKGTKPYEEGSCVKEETEEERKDREKQLKKFKDQVAGKQIAEVASGNPGRGYHGSVQSPDDKYEAIHKHVKNLTDGDDKTVKHYLDSGHGRHLAGKEDDHAYIKKDFAKFCKYYNPETLQNKKVNEGTIQFTGTDKIETAGNTVPAKTPKGKVVKAFKFFTTEGKMKSYHPDSELPDVVAKKRDVPFDGPYTKTPSTTVDKSGAKHTPMSRARHLAKQALSSMKEDMDESYNGPRGDKLIARSHAAHNAGDKETSSRAHKLAMKAGEKYRSNPVNRDKAIAHIMSGASQDYKDQEKKRGIGHVRDHVELEGNVITEANAPVAPVPDKKYIKGTPENKAAKAARKPINGHPTNKTNEEVEESYDFDTAAMAKQELAHVKNAKKRKRGKIANLLRAAGLKENQMEKLSFKEFASALQEAAKIAKPVNVDKVNHAGDTPHEEKWEPAKGASKVKKESFSADALLSAIKEGMWPGTPEYEKKFPTRKTGAGARHDIEATSTGVKATRRYEAEPDHDDEPASAGRPQGAKSGARKNLGNSKLHQA